MRTRTQPTQSPLITREELLTMGDIGPCDLVEGRIKTLSPTSPRHGIIEVRLSRLLASFVEPRRLGWVIGGGVGIYTRRNPDMVRGADLAFYSRERLPSVPPRGFLEVAPELGVEILSPEESWTEVQQKMEEYFSIGAERVWVVEPNQHQIIVFSSPTQRVVLGEEEILRGEGVLTGLEILLAQIFEE